MKAYFAEYLVRVALMTGLSAAAVLWVKRFPVKNIGIFVLDGMLYTVVFSAAMFLLYHKTEAFCSLKMRCLTLLRRGKKEK